MCDTTVCNYLNLIIKNHGFVEHDVHIPGKTGKGEGYLGGVSFVTISGKTKNGERKVLNLVLKTPTSNKIVREKVPLKELYRKEIYIYEVVVPTFKNFQKEVGIGNDLLQFLPECLLTDKTEGKEYLVLENLKPRGFDLWNRYKTMPYQYIKLVLETFAKWHAFSLALRYKRPDGFEKLVNENNPNMWNFYFEKLDLYGTVYRFFDEVRTIWKDDTEISEKLKFTVKDAKYIFNDLLLEDPDYRVISHGDNWTNNMMFKLKEDGKTPSSVCIFDWQFSGIASPIIDLSYFVYTCVDTGIYKDVRDLLDIYYKSLSDCLSQLGCNSLEVFPYNVLLQHWQKYSCYGVFMGSFILKFCLSEGDETPDFTEVVESGRDLSESFNFSIKVNEKMYHERIRNNYHHYIQNSRLTN